MAKFYKITLLFTALVLSVIVAFSMMTFSVNASKASEPSKYFSGVTAENLEFKDDALVATVKDGDSLTITNKLVIDDFSATIVLPEAEKFETISVKVVSDSYFVNGKIKDGELITKVENVLTIKADGTAYLNNDESNTVALSGESVISIKAENGFLTFNDQLIASNDYRIDSVGAPVAQLSFVFDLKENATSAEFAIKSINQKVSDANNRYEQLFTVDQDGALNDTAYPRITLNDDLYKKNLDGTSELVFNMNVSETLSYNVFSVLGGKASDFYLKTAEGYNATIDTSSNKPKWIMFTSIGEKYFNVTYGSASENEYVEQFKVKVVEYGADNEVPVYVDNEEALESFKLALKKACMDEDGNSAYLGKTIDIPSLADLVCDNEIPYAELKTTVYYKTPSTVSTSSSMGIEIKEAGDYLFFVAFSDGANKMVEEDFMKENEDGAVEFGKYQKYVFSFHISDDSPISIETGTATGVGFKGIVYSASPFKIDAEGCTTTYSLYYNADKNAKADDEGWKLIPETSTVKDENYSDEFGNTYSYVKGVNYDGKLTFKPTKIGSYKIVCKVSSEYTTRSDSAYKMIVVESEPTYVEVPSTLLRDNVWSVVFLSVGTLCLIGIIVLLCIKPKDETESD